MRNPVNDNRPVFVLDWREDHELGDPHPDGLRYKWIPDTYQGTPRPPSEWKFKFLKGGTYEIWAPKSHSDVVNYLAITTPHTTFGDTDEYLVEFGFRVCRSKS